MSRERSPPKIEQNSKKMPKKKFIFSKVAGSKSEFIQMFFKAFAKSLSDFVNDVYGRLLL